VTVAVARGRTAALDHELLWTAVGLWAAVTAWLLLRQPWPAPFGACLFKALTGWPCLTCGGTRALRALLAGEAGMAVRSNPLVALTAMGWAVYACYGGGAIVGAWPRLRLRVAPAERAWLRAGALLALASTWGFLVFDGR